MGFRTKLILIFVVFGLVPMLALTAVNYITGVRAVEATLKGDLVHDAIVMSRGIELELQKQEHLIALVGRSDEVAAFVSSRGANGEPVSAKLNGAPAVSDVPQDLRKLFESFFSHVSSEVLSATIVDSRGNSLVTFTPVHSQSESSLHEANLSVQAYPKPFVLPGAVWSKPSGSLPVRLDLQRSAEGTTLCEAMPAGSGEQESGAVVVEIALDAVIREVTGKQLPLPHTYGAANYGLIILDSSQTLLHHSNNALSYQNASLVMPGPFAPVASAMASGQAGEMSYEGQDGKNWTIAFRPVNGLGLSVGAQADSDAAISGLKRQAVLSLIIASVVGLFTTILVAMILKRVTSSIERVAMGAAAVAAGDLDQHIEVSASGETRVLAESFNQMTERLREQIAREAESRQFESFMRLSAMLTHDLKNAIAGLALLVRNMEKQFHREEFRRDAMRSLVESTDKLRQIVSKLSEPVQTLSGEHQRPRPIDLVGILKDVVTTHVDRNSDVLKLEISLPDKLVAFAEKDRIEKVIENLVINAVEAMGSNGGKLKITGGEQNDGSIYFTVADTGPGMTQAFQRDKLFQAFATTKSNGVGLGLYTCREIVRAHGGYIDVSSKPNLGTEFKVVLPSTQFTAP